MYQCAHIGYTFSCIQNVILDFLSKGFCQVPEKKVHFAEKMLTIPIATHFGTSEHVHSCTQPKYPHLHTLISLWNLRRTQILNIEENFNHFWYISRLKFVATRKSNTQATHRHVCKVSFKSIEICDGNDIPFQVFNWFEHTHAGQPVYV